MKKPVLLLVDDDRAILEALESLLTPAFSSFCRIEAFDHPEAALQACGGWDEEMRSVVAGIIDQRMPGLTGVEFIARLRKLTAGSSMRALLLTGHSGLDSALDAKNKAGIDRYFEKPWNGPDLISALKSLIRKSLQALSVDRFLQLREVMGTRAVRDHLQLRHRVRRLNRAPAAAGADAVDIFDVDHYDRKSRLFSLCRESSTEENVVAVTRVIMGTDGPATQALLNLVENNDALQQRLNTPRKTLLPAMEDALDAPAITLFLANTTERDETVAELGRVSLAPATWPAPGIGLALALRHTLESVAAILLYSHQFDHAIHAATPSHKRIVATLGASQLAGTRPHYSPALASTVSCFMLHRDTVPTISAKRLDALTRRHHRLDTLCLCPTYPDCTPGPYGDGNFLTTDLFCPAEAVTTLAHTQETS